MRRGEAPGAQKSQRESFFPEKGFLLAFGMRDNGKESRESRLQSPPPDGGVTRESEQGHLGWSWHQRGQVLTVSQPHGTQGKSQGVRVMLRESRPEGARGWENNDLSG